MPKNNWEKVKELYFLHHFLTWKQWLHILYYYSSEPPKNVLTCVPDICCITPQASVLNLIIRHCSAPLLFTNATNTLCIWIFQTPCKTDNNDNYNAIFFTFYFFISGKYAEKRDFLFLHGGGWESAYYPQL